LLTVQQRSEWSNKDDAQSAPVTYFASARAYALDLAATLFLFVSASVMAGRVWRFPFDDEIATLSMIEPQGAREALADFPATNDIHPPLSYAIFYGLRELGLSDSSMRLCSLVMTALALLLCQLLALTWIARRDGAVAPAQTRIVAVLMFGLMPLAVSQGDALRWYPVFTLLMALFVTFYLVPREGLTQLWSSAALGLAASTDFSAALVVPPFLIYRYVLQRRFRWSFDLVYWLITAVCASIGFCSAYWIFSRNLTDIWAAEFGSGIVRSALTDVLGFFGGDALGVSQAWIIIPTVVVFAIAMGSEIDRRHPGKPVHLLLLMLSGPVLVALAGFTAPRSFLYLVPTVAVLLTLFFDRQARKAHAASMLAAVVLPLVTSISAIANVNCGTHPFKRNSAIPYQSIFDFIDSNAKGTVLVVSTDPVVPWMLRAAADGRCAGYFLEVERCLESGDHYDSIFVVFGHSDKSADELGMTKFKRLIANITAGRSKTATLPAGRDEDALLKSQLTGVPLERDILTVDCYQ
jgi:hypothetical protein